MVRLTMLAGLANLAASAKLKPSDTIPDYLSNYGIPVEEHWTTTEDGYILKLFRLARPGAPVLLLQHGVLASAWCWLFNSPDLAPGIQLFNEGYDIWLTNSRGNLFSKNHTSLEPEFSKEFWDFSFADMGRYDVPANIDYVLQQTGKPQLSFVAWSQGTSQFFVSMTDDKTKALVDEKVNLFVALSPVTFMEHQSSFLLKIVTDLHIGALVEAAFPYGFLDYKSLATVAQLFCKLTLGALCKITVDLICGQSSLDNPKAITNMTAHFPSGTSVKALAHYEQEILSDQFCEYDYGDDNQAKYGSDTPPSYDLSKISVPTALFVASEDTMANPADVETLMSGMPTPVFKDEFTDFSHMTWLTGTDSAFQTWYPKMSQLLRQYNSPGVVV